MRIGFPPPKHILPALQYRILRPFFWEQWTRRRLSDSSDTRFFHSFGWMDDPAEFQDFMKEKSRLRFFFHPRNRKDFFLNTLTTTQSYETILEAADHTLGNRFQTIGSPFVELGDPVPWHRDFKSGKEWPLKPAHELDILDLKNPSDVKVPWELSRFHQVWWLGKAHWLTGNQAYAEKFGGLVADWIEKNPLGYGVNWAVAMEASIRACNWIAGYYFFCESRVLNQDFWLRFFRNLLMHGLFIESHLEYSRVNGNHFLSNVVGLIYLGFFFRDLPVGKRWLRWGISGLQKEMEEQVYADGVNHEKSTAYHRLVLELFYSAAILCRRNNVSLRSEFTKRLEKMFDYVHSYTRLDGTIPLIGDADDGRLFRISMNQDINDHRHALLIGGLMFERSDLVTAAGRFDQEALWYFGGEGFELYQRLRGTEPSQESRAFPEGGFYVLRSKDAHVFIDAGDIGMRGRGGHGHNDTLSFELWHKAPFIVDSGTYAYTADTVRRRLLQGTAAHNTVMVDDVELAEWNDLWSVEKDVTKPRVIIWTTTAEEDTLEAEHHGYIRLADPVIHRRKFVFDKSSHKLIVTDTLAGSRAHTVQLRFHFNPDVSVEMEEKNRYLLQCGNELIRITCSEEAEIIETLFSPSYGILCHSKGLQIRLHTTFPFTITTQITLL